MCSRTRCEAIVSQMHADFCASPVCSAIRDGPVKRMRCCPLTPQFARAGFVKPQLDQHEGSLD